MARILLFCLLCLAAAARAETPAYGGYRVSSAEDIAAITQITEDFRAAIIAKDVKKLSGLMHDDAILFDSPGDAETVQRVKDTMDVNYDGLGGQGYVPFANFVRNSKDPVEEKFYNLSITQDANVAWAMFDFEFLLSDKVVNYGVETWQLMKNSSGQWKIFSVVWSSHGVKKPTP
jgi:hypothetical protein